MGDLRAWLHDVSRSTSSKKVIQMTVSLISAQPIELLRYVQRAGQVNTGLHGTSGQLAQALARFNATCTEYHTGADGRLAEALRGYVGRAAPVDEWVGQVARDFQRSDLAPPLGALAPVGGSMLENAARDALREAMRQVIRDQIAQARDWLLRPARQAYAFASTIARTLGGIGRQAFDFAVAAPRRLASAVATGAERAAIGAWQGLTGLARGVWHFVKSAAQRIAQFLGWLRQAFASTLRIMGGGLEMLVGFARALKPGIVAAARAYLTHAVGFVKGFWEGVWDFVSGTGTLLLDIGKLAIGDRETWAKYGQIVEAFRADPLGTLKTMGKAIVEPIVDDWRHGRYGEVAGRVTFEALPTILAAFTGGGSEAAYLSKLGKVARVARAGEEAGDGLRVAARLAGSSLRSAAVGAVRERIARIATLGRNAIGVLRAGRDMALTVARGNLRELKELAVAPLRDWIASGRAGMAFNYRRTFTPDKISADQLIEVFNNLNTHNGKWYTIISGKKVRLPDTLNIDGQLKLHPSKLAGLTPEECSTLEEAIKALNNASGDLAKVPSERRRYINSLSSSGGQRLRFEAQSKQVQEFLKELHASTETNPLFQNLDDNSWQRLYDLIKPYGRHDRRFEAHAFSLKQAQSVREYVEWFEAYMAEVLKHEVRKQKAVLKHEVIEVPDAASIEAATLEKYNRNYTYFKHHGGSVQITRSASDKSLITEVKKIAD
jgi:hypothetical protein